MSKDDVEIIGPYQIGKTIGQGIFAKVKLGEDEFRQKVAIKIFDKLLLSRSQHQLLQVEKELNSLRCCHHPHIVQFYEVLETNDKIYLVMEHLAAGELYDYILDQGRLSEEEGGRLFGQIVSAVHHCHQHGIVHRDLKPENILLQSPLPSQQHHRCKLVDFGLANYYDTSVEDEHHSLRTLQTQCGSPHYASPEILTGQKYNGPAADIWSLGVLLFAMLCGSLPFNARSVPLLIKKIVEGKFKFPKFLSSSSRHLIGSILQIQPEQRPGIEEMMRHPWMLQYAMLEPTTAMVKEISPVPSSQTESTPNNDSIAASTASGPPSLFRPLSRPEIINPETSRPAPGDLERMMMKHSQSHRRSGKGAEAAAALPPSNALNFHTTSETLALSPQSVTSPASSSSSFLSDLLSFPSPRKRQPIRCQFCGKILNVRVSESGDLLLAASSAIKEEAANHAETNGASSAAGGQAAEDKAALSGKYELCACQRSRAGSPSLGVENTIAAAETDKANASSSAAAGSDPSVKSSTPRSVPRELSSVLSSDSLTGNFQANSLRENYFHPDDPRRKSKRQQKLEQQQAVLSAAEEKKKKEEELVRVKNEELFLRACEIGDSDTVTMLIEPPTDDAGLSTGPPLVDVRAKAIDNWTGLHYAARGGHLGVVQALLSSLQPIDINCRTKSSWSALMIAADKGHIEVCKMLVKYGAAIHITNSDGKSAIFLARESGYHDIAQFLTTASSIRHKRHALLSQSSTQTAEGGVDDGERSLNYELFRACEYGDIGKVTHLLELNREGNKPEHVSRRNGQIREKEKQQAAAEDPNAANANSSTAPSSNPTPRYSVDVCARGIDYWTALHFAARKGRAAIVQLLLSHTPPAPINAVTKNGWSALMMACDKGYTDVVSILLEHGADINIISLDGYSAYSVAKEGQQTEIMNMIMEHARKQNNNTNKSIATQQQTNNNTTTATPQPTLTSTATTPATNTAEATQTNP